jgi:hypothetical protein
VAVERLHYIGLGREMCSPPRTSNSIRVFLGDGVVGEDVDIDAFRAGSEESEQVVCLRRLLQVPVRENRKTTLWAGGVKVGI